MQALLWPLISWIFRDVVVKFVVFVSLFGILAFLVPKAISLVAPWVGVSGLNAAFGGLPAGVWFFLDVFQIPFGVPLLISAGVTRFLIRRMPLIG